MVVVVVVVVVVVYVVVVLLNDTVVSGVDDVVAMTTKVILSTIAVEPAASIAARPKLNRPASSNIPTITPVSALTVQLSGASTSLNVISSNVPLLTVVLAGSSAKCAIL